MANCTEGDCANGYGANTYNRGNEYVGEWKN